MKPAAIANNFKKAIGSTLLTAGAALADAHRQIDIADFLKREEIQQQLLLSMRFCELLLEPVHAQGLKRAEVPGFAETYCRKHVLRAAKFHRKALKSKDPKSPAVKRLVHIAGLIRGKPQTTSR